MNTVDRIAERFLDDVHPTGNNHLRAASPFKDGKSAKRAFRINRETGMWNDYSADKFGSLPSLLYHFGLDRDEVDRLLAAGDWKKPLSQATQRLLKLKEQPATLPEWVLGAYDYLPVSLLNSGFTEDTLNAHDIGYDTLNERVIYPIRDYRGRLVALSGRATQDWQQPRYKVYTSRELGEAVPGYEPANTAHLFGLHRFYARRIAEREPDRPLIVVEGYKGCMWLQQLGFTDVVALQGSYMTEEQARILSRLAGPYVVFLDFEYGKQVPDPDKNGRAAALYIAKTLGKSGRTTLATYPGNIEDDAGLAPDDLDLEGVQYALTNSISRGQLAVRNGIRNSIWSNT